VPAAERLETAPRLRPGLELRFDLCARYHENASSLWGSYELSFVAFGRAGAFVTFRGGNCCA
jgi:hypothetical protein